MRRDERGSASLEAVVLVPAIVLVVACLVGGARLWFARAVVAEAAHGAARAATLERDGGVAASRARVVAGETLRTRGLACGDPSVAVDTSGFAVAVGLPARVRVDVTCQVPLADLFGLALPGTVAARGQGVSALDTYRERR